jgi:hypothetical protein
VKAQAEEEGLDRILKEAGFEWREAGCSMCLGMNPDKLKPGQRSASTSNRNFEGRQGPGGRTHLLSPAMAAAAVQPMARRCFGNAVRSVLDWAPERAPQGSTRTAAGMALALAEHPGALVLIGSAPTALEVLLELVRTGATTAPALVIGMPVGFVGVAESKRHLAETDLPQIRLEGSRGGAGLVGAAANALLRWAWLRQPPT